MSDTASSASSSRTSFSGESRVTMSSTSSDAASTISDASSARTTGSSVLGQYVYSSYKAITESVRSRPATEEDREKQLARAQAKEAKRAAQAQRDREMQEMRLREYAALRQSADDAKARLKSGKPLAGMYNSQAANHCVLRYM